MRSLDSRALVAVLLVVMFFIGAETAYYFGNLGSRTVTSVLISTATSTVTAPSMILQDFTLCSNCGACPSPTCSVTYGTLSGTIILGEGSPSPLSVRLYVNGTDEGVESCGAAQKCQVMGLGLIFYSHNFYQNGLIVAGESYRIEIVGLFVGNLTSTAFTQVIAE